MNILADECVAVAVVARLRADVMFQDMVLSNFPSL